VLRRMKTHEFKGSDRSKNEKFFALSQHKVWSALFLSTIIFEFALGICGIAFIALSMKAGQSSSLSVHDWTKLIIGICMLGLVVLSIVNLWIITTKRHLLLDKLRK
jgi:hypothetical protein